MTTSWTGSGARRGAAAAAAVLAGRGDRVAFWAGLPVAGVAVFLAAALAGVAFLVAACFFAAFLAVRGAFLGPSGPGVSSGGVTKAS
jgi:hypothetical protein